MSVSIAELTAEHHHDGLGIFSSTPRLSWRFNATEVKGWRQASYEVVISRKDEEKTFQVDSSESILVPWPDKPLSSRETATVKVRATGQDQSVTEWSSLTVEVALLKRSDWTAQLISCPAQGNDAPKRPFRLRKAFNVQSKDSARLYATTHGMYEVEINGKRVSDQLLAPGWQSYKHRLHYQTYDITSYLNIGETNVIGAYVAEGWYAGRLGGQAGVTNVWGDRVSFLGQLEIGGEVVLTTDDTWEYLDGPITTSEIYDGEVYDTNLDDPSWSTSSFSDKKQGMAEVLPFPSAELIAPDVAPVRRIMEVKPKEIITTPKGKKVLDFGQNLVGWLRIEKDIEGEAGDELLIKHAEVLEHGELGTRPLRNAKARELIKLGGKTKGYEPRFTFHGFR